MAHSLTSTAIPVKQPGLKKGQQIYTAAIAAKDLIDTTMFKVDIWRKELTGKEDQGYQRVPNDRHFQKIANYLENSDALLPTSIVLSARDTQLEYAGSKLTIKAPPVWIVDGQHRIAGLRTAIEDRGLANWGEASIPVIILSGFEKFEEMAQFVELNDKQKRVETGLALQLMHDMALQKPEWRDRIVAEGNAWKVVSIMLVNELNKRNDSSWKNRIKIAGEKSNKGQFVTTSTSFATSLKPLVRGTFDAVRNADTNYEILNTYWDCLRDLLPDAFLEPKDYAIQKTPGLFSLHDLLQAILVKKGYKFGLQKEQMKALLNKIFIHSKTPVDFWRSDNNIGVTMYGSMKGFRLLADKFKISLNEVDGR